MEPNSSDQPRPWYRFSLAKLLVGITLLCLSLGIVGVPATLLVLNCLAAFAVYLRVARRFGVVLASFVWLMLLGFLSIFLSMTMKAMYFLLR